MLPKPLKYLHRLTLPIAICSLVLLTSCEHSKEGSTTTDKKKSVLARPGQARLVAQDTPIKTYVKDEKGVLTMINDVARKGEYVLPDPGPKDPPRPPVVDPIPTPAPVSLPSPPPK